MSVSNPISLAAVDRMSKREKQKFEQIVAKHHGLSPVAQLDDAIAEALQKTRDGDTGALFEKEVLDLLVKIRSNDPPRWARIRQEARAVLDALRQEVEMKKDEPKPMGFM